MCSTFFKCIVPVLKWANFPDVLYRHFSLSYPKKGQHPCQCRFSCESISPSFWISITCRVEKLVYRANICLKPDTSCLIILFFKHFLSFSLIISRILSAPIYILLLLKFCVDICWDAFHSSKIPNIVIRSAPSISVPDLFSGLDCLMTCQKVQTRVSDKQFYPFKMA